jgi:molybdate transport system substrate-binding protein
VAARHKAPASLHILTSGGFFAAKADAPRPDISTPAALRSTLLQAKSVAWSDSASGVYIQSTMPKRLGIADQGMAKGHKIPATPVGQIVASGQAQIGLQPLGALKTVRGIQILGLVPDSLQKVTPFSAGIVTGSAHRADARALLAFLTSAQARTTIRQSGLEPVAQGSGR